MKNKIKTSQRTTYVSKQDIWLENWDSTQDCYNLEI